MCFKLEARVARMLKRGDVDNAARALAENMDVSGSRLAQRQNLLAICKIKSNQIQSAKTLLQEICLKGHIDARVLNNLGNVALLETNAETALKLYKEAIKLNPWALEPRFNLGIAYSALGNFEQSLLSHLDYTRLKRTLNIIKFFIAGLFLILLMITTLQICL